MDIDILENQIRKLEGTNVHSILQLLISAVRDYPAYNMNDTDVYMNELKKILRSKKVTPELIEKYIESNSDKEDENNIWTISSLMTLLDAFNLMVLYKEESFENIMQKI